MGALAPPGWGALRMSGAASLLDVAGVSVRFGGIVALKDVSFSLAPEKICGLIGPNGAGKTTLFNCLSRLYEVSAGSIVFAGQSLLGLRRHDIARLGIARTFQNVALFDEMSVLENVMVGAHGLGRAGFIAAALRSRAERAEEKLILARAESLVEEFGLGGGAGRAVGQLPFGTRKRVEMARALAMNPRLLLLDEPAAGLNHEEVEGLITEIRAIRDRRKVAVLLVEHHMNLVMRVSDQVVALNFGRVIADGTPAHVQADAQLLKAYLGDDA